MPTGYSFYLFYLVAVIVFFTGLFIFFSRNKRKNNKTEVRKSKPITLGNISVFFDMNENVTIIAYTTDIFGVGRATGNPAFLSIPYSYESLGKAVRSAMYICKNGLPSGDMELMKMLGFKGWKEFSQGRRNISVHFKAGYGVVLNPTIRKQDGAYQFIGTEKIISQDVSDIELGKAVKEVLQRCR